MKYLLLLLLAFRAGAASVTVACTAPSGPPISWVVFYVATNAAFSSPQRVVVPASASQTVTNKLTNLVASATNFITASAISTGGAEGDTCAPISVWVPAQVTLGTVPVQLSSVQLPPGGGTVSVSRDLVLWNERLTVKTNGTGMTVTALLVADQPVLFLSAVPPSARARAPLLPNRLEK